MKKIICWLLGHKWRPYNGDFMEPYCIRCGEHPGIAEIFKQAFKK